MSLMAKEAALKQRGSKEANEGRGNEYNRGRTVISAIEAERQEQQDRQRTATGNIYSRRQRQRSSSRNRQRREAKIITVEYRGTAKRSSSRDRGRDIAVIAETQLSFRESLPQPGDIYNYK